MLPCLREKARLVGEVSRGPGTMTGHHVPGRIHRPRRPVIHHTTPHREGIGECRDERLARTSLPAKGGDPRRNLEEGEGIRESRAFRANGCLSVFFVFEDGFVIGDGISSIESRGLGPQKDNFFSQISLAHMELVKSCPSRASIL